MVASLCSEGASRWLMARKGSSAFAPLIGVKQIQPGNRENVEIDPELACAAPFSRTPEAA